MIFTPTFRIQFDSSLSNFAEDLPWMMVGASIMFGVMVALYIIIKTGDCCLGSSSFKSRPWREHKRRTRRSSRSFIRVLLVLLCTIVGFFGFWIAFSVMGVNFWNILFGYGVLVLIMNQMFGVALQSIGAYIIISYTDKIEEDFWVEVIGMPNVEGTVMSINLIWVELEYIDKNNNKESVKELQVPTIVFITNIIRRHFDREKSI